MTAVAALTNADKLTNGAKIVGEALVPGASLLVDGRVGYGILHTALAIGAGALLGPLGVAAVAVNSFAESTTGSSPLSYLAEKTKLASRRAVAAAEAVVDPAPATTDTAPATTTTTTSKSAARA